MKVQAFLLFSFFCSFSWAVGVTVNSELGEIVGVSEDGIFKFKGIPYAEAPVGDLRWEFPLPKKPWAPSVFNASSYTAACPQIYYPPNEDPYITVPLSEDCLQLNIYTPTIDANASLPVMVYIHGGLFHGGWGGDSIFWGDYIANYTKDTILVTINYRLAALGFLTTEEVPGNFGFLDQQLAMQWVQDNIVNFGGNPNEVTLFGQSAGAMSVLLHIISPSSEGLFKRAISESNPMGINYKTTEQSLEYAEKLAENLGCNVANLTCLRSKSWNEIVDAQQHVNFLFLPLNTTVVMPFNPTIDGKIIPDQPLEMVKRAQINPNIEAIAFGSNRNDSMTFTPNGKVSAVEFAASIYLFFGIENGTKILEQYPPKIGRDNSNLNSIAATDWLFDCPNRLAATSLSNVTNTYVYHFMHVGSDIPINQSHPECQYAVCHSDELVYVFHSSEFENATYEPDEVVLSFQMLSYWTDFAHGKTTPKDKNLPEWPLFSPSTKQSISFDIPITTLTNYNNEKCDFWDTLGYYH